MTYHQDIYIITRKESGNELCFTGHFNVELDLDATAYQIKFDAEQDVYGDEYLHPVQGYVVGLENAKRVCENLNLVFNTRLETNPATYYPHDDKQFYYVSLKELPSYLYGEVHLLNIYEVIVYQDTITKQWKMFNYEEYNKFSPSNIKYKHTGENPHIRVIPTYTFEKDLNRLLTYFKWVDHPITGERSIEKGLKAFKLITVGENPPIIELAASWIKTIDEEIQDQINGYSTEENTISRMVLPQGTTKLAPDFNKELEKQKLLTKIGYYSLTSEQKRLLKDVLNKQG